MVKDRQTCSGPRENTGKDLSSIGPTTNLRTVAADYIAYNLHGAAPRSAGVCLQQPTHAWPSHPACLRLFCCVAATLSTFPALQVTFLHLYRLPSPSPPELPSHGNHKTTVHTCLWHVAWDG